MGRPSCANLKSQLISNYCSKTLSLPHGNLLLQEWFWVEESTGLLSNLLFLRLWVMLRRYNVPHRNFYYISQMIKKIWLTEWIKLYFRGGGIWDEWMKYLCDSIGSVRLYSYTTLDVSINKISDTGIESLCDMLERVGIGKWLQLFLSDNDISDAWLLQLVSVIKRSGQWYLFVDLSFNSKISNSLKRLCDFENESWLFGPSVRFHRGPDST